MPNWCHNRVSIYCEDERVLDEIEEIFTSPEPFNAIMPLPKEEEENWYNWRMENWGVKWDISEVDSDKFHDRLILEFETPWGAPEGIKSRLEDIYGDEDIGISWFYDEPMMELAGYL